RQIGRLGWLFSGLSRAIYLSPQEARVRPWFRDNGDKTKRLFYDLGPESVVVDLGGYEGQWTSDIAAMYACYVHTFEPVPQFADYIRNRFARNPKISVYEFGLAGSTRLEQITLDRDGTSLYRPGLMKQTIRLERAVDFLQEQQIYPVDLMKINIE